jgi:hypothetical protein
VSDYDWKKIEAALASAEDRRLLPEKGRPIRSPEQTTILQHYYDRLGAGLAAEDRSDLDRIREEYQAEGQRFHEVEKDRAIERSSGRLAMLQSSIAASRDATEEIMSRKGQAPDSELLADWIVLDVARSIRFKGQTVIDKRGTGTALEPWDNKAKVESAWPSVNHLGYEAGVGFVFLWTNPNDYSVVLDVESWIALNGFCTAGADGSFIGDNSTVLDVITFLEPSLPLGSVYPPAQPGQTVVAGEVSADGGGFLGLGEIRSLSVAGYYGMYYHNLIVPGGGLAVFEVGSLFSAGATGDGFAKADFLSGDFQVMCPMVALTIV